MVLPGISSLGEHKDLFKNKKTGLITNHTGVDHNLRNSIDLFIEAGIQITALFGPEHGVRGAAQAGEKVDSHRDPQTGIPVHSLYGANKKPTPEMLEGVDILAFDIQDTGTRFYTYIYTMTLAMEAAAEKGIPFAVFDRPNPLGGKTVEGSILDAEKFSSFVGLYPVPHRYALTIGEFAQFAADKFIPDCDLHIIPLKNWKREMLWKDTKLNWVMPSPNIPTTVALEAYTGTVIFEGTNVSEGRGTAKPFSLVGAPWIDPEKLASAMNKNAADGLIFRPHYFAPSFSKYAGEQCGGVEIHREAGKEGNIGMVETGYRLLDTIRTLWPDKFEFLKPAESGPLSIEQRRPFISLLTGSSKLFDGVPLSVMTEEMRRDEKIFSEIKRGYHIYD